MYVCNCIQLYVVRRYYIYSGQFRFLFQSHSVQCPMSVVFQDIFQEPAFFNGSTTRGFLYSTLWQFYIAIENGQL